MRTCTVPSGCGCHCCSSTVLSCAPVSVIVCMMLLNGCTANASP